MIQSEDLCGFCIEPIHGAVVEAFKQKFHPGHDKEYDEAMRAAPSHDPGDDFEDYGRFDYGGA